MKTLVLAAAVCLVCSPLLAVNAPQAVVSRTGDRSIVLHWDRNTEPGLAGYRVYRASSPDGPYATNHTGELTSPSFCDLKVTNGISCYYRVTAVTTGGEESVPSATLGAAARTFASNDEFLEYVQQTAFDYFWYEANPANGLVADRSRPSSPCSIAAVGFGLTAIGIGIDHSWITREQGRERVLRTLNTFWAGPQGPADSGIIGHMGWFYHFLDMRTALRFTAFNTELSSIDTALLLAGVLYAEQYFDGAHADEVIIRQRADDLVNRVDWQWMAQGTDVLSMGWRPGTGFISSKWQGYNEAAILYCLSIGAASNSIPASAWQTWTKGFNWSTNYGYAFIPFPPLFGHQYSQCWLDLRHTSDAFMRTKSSTYYENSRRATLAQRAYCIANPQKFAGYGGNVWGLTACDGPTGYAARGAPPPENDDGTIAPTAPGGSVAFAPEHCIASLRYMYDHFRPFLWTGYGFRDAFNLGKDWWAPEILGIDQGPIILSIENYRTGKPWRLFMRNAEVQRWLGLAGFHSLAMVPVRLEAFPQQAKVDLSWEAAGKETQVEYSPNLETWYASPTGRVASQEPIAGWTDSGPPATVANPFAVPTRFYRVLQLAPQE